MKNLIVSHQGHTENYPGNSLASFFEALSLKTDKIEFDVHSTSDNELIIYHNYDLSTLKNGSGFIFEKDSSYIKTLILSKSGEKIPFLEEIYKNIGNKTSYEIELKGFSFDFVDKVINLSNKYKLINLIEFTSPHEYLLSYIKSKYKNIKVGMFVKEFPDWMPNYLGQKILRSNAIFGNIDVLHFPLNMLNEQFIKDLHRDKFVVHAANCNTEVEIKKALDLNVDQISTDNLKLAIKLRDKYEK